MIPVAKFIKERTSVFSEASRGDFSGNNPELEALREDLFKDTEGFPPFYTDKKNIVSDSKRVAADFRHAIEKYSR